MPLLSTDDKLRSQVSLGFFLLFFAIFLPSTTQRLHVRRHDIGWIIVVLTQLAAARSQIYIYFYEVVACFPNCEAEMWPVWQMLLLLFFFPCPFSLNCKCCSSNSGGQKGLLPRKLKDFKLIKHFMGFTSRQREQKTSGRWLASCQSGSVEISLTFGRWLVVISHPACTLLAWRLIAPEPSRFANKETCASSRDPMYPSLDIWGASWVTRCSKRRGNTRLKPF